MRSSIRMLQQRGIVRDPALEAALEDAEELRDLLARGSENRSRSVSALLSMPRTKRSLRGTNGHRSNSWRQTDSSTCQLFQNGARLDMYAAVLSGRAGF